ncbi:MULTISPECIES: ATP-binding protein [Streptomyces]|uniref:ATP-binding protein n=1 Tax=Streptomyces TaxID=1883 RepID=UPI00288AE894|nr:ATP-binding protein [Streptomyces sp. EAS-AB2608]
MIFAAVTTSVAGMSQSEVPRAFEVAFAPNTTCARQARRDTRACLRRWNVPDSLAEDIVLTVSELVTNGVLHGNGDVGLRIRQCCGELRVEVTDDNPAPGAALRQRQRRLRTWAAPSRRPL